MSRLLIMILRWRFWAFVVDWVDEVVGDVDSVMLLYMNGV